MPEPYQVPRPVDKQTKGKQSFGRNSFCAACGVKADVTKSYFNDPVTGQRTAGLLCSDCWAEAIEAEAEAESDEDDLLPQVFPVADARLRSFLDPFAAAEFGSYAV